MTNIETIREETIRTIEQFIWACENMGTDCCRRDSVTEYRGRAQGAIEMTYNLGVITKEERDEFWNAANRATGNNPAYWRV